MDIKQIWPFESLKFNDMFFLIPAAVFCVIVCVMCVVCKDYKICNCTSTITQNGLTKLMCFV